MTLKDFINLNKDALNNPKFSIESIIKQSTTPSSIRLDGYNKLTDNQRNAFIILTCILAGRKIYYLLKKRSFEYAEPDVYLYINKIPYANAFIFGFRCSKHTYNDAEDLKFDIATTWISEYTDENLPMTPTLISQLENLLEPAEH